MKSVFYSLCLVGCLLLQSCGPTVNKSMVLGKWQGINLEYPDGGLKHKGLVQSAKAMYFEFKEDDTYTGTDISGNPESGTYSTLGDMLYLTPKKDSKRAFELKSAEGDQLVFNVNPGAIGVLLTLKRK